MSGKLVIKAGHPAVAEKFSPGDEQSFKTEMLRVKRILHPGRTYFEIENEEKEPGFPDTIEIFENQRVRLVEYKVSDKAGVIEFQRGQPLFYRRNRALDIRVIAWSVPDNSYYVFTADQVLEAVKAHAKTLKVSVKDGVIQ